MLRRRIRLPVEMRRYVKMHFGVVPALSTVEIAQVGQIAGRIVAAGS